MRITILDRWDFPVSPVPGQTRVRRAITYQAGVLPPRTIYVDLDEWTEEKEKELIREDIEKVKTFTPEEYEV